MIITAFTIAKDLAQAKELGINKFYGDLCPVCNTLVRYKSNNNCVKCLSDKKVKGGKSPKVPGEFYCKECRVFLPNSRLGRTVTTTKGSWSLCITHDKEDKARHAARRRHEHPHTITAL